MSNNATKKQFHLSVSNVRGIANQPYYRKRMTISNEDELRKAICFDHVCAELEDNYRNADNFLSIDCFFADVDNDDKKNTEAWDDPEYHLSIERFHEKFKDYEYIIYTSRNHMKPKPHGESNVRKPREKFHVLFPLGVVVDDGEKVEFLLSALIESFKRDDGLHYFDTNLKDRCRFLFGVDVDESTIIWNEGKSIVEYLDNCTVMDEINQTSNFGDKSCRADYDKKPTKFYFETVSKLKIEDVFTDIDFRSSGSKKPDVSDYLKGICPFHDDHKPSFSVNRRTLRWKCRAGCGEGYAVEYLVKRDNIEYKEAERKLCEMAGVEYRSFEQGDTDNPIKKLLSIAESFDIFRNEDGGMFVRMDVHEIVKLTSTEFKRKLKKIFYDDTGKTPTRTQLDDVVDLLHNPETEYQKNKLNMRVAKLENKIYLDLCDDHGNVVEIRDDGWNIVQNPPVYFERKSGMKPLVKPNRNGSLDDLKQVLNFQNEDQWRLIVGWILGTLMVERPFPILNITGNKGSGKSFMTEIIRNIIDPHVSAKRSLPTNENILKVAAQNSYILAFDNIRNIPQSLSDNLCIVSTGGSFSDREKYSDDRENSFNGRRPVILNGIEYKLRDDLASRSIYIPIPSIPDEETKTEEELENILDEILPGVLGAICDTVSSILKNYKNVKLQIKNRMADFETWVTAAEDHLGWEEGSFSRVLTNNVNQTKEKLISEDYLGTAISNFIDDQSGNQWSGTASELLERLKKYEDIEYLPKGPQALSRKITERRSSWSVDYGFNIEINNKKISISKSDRNTVISVNIVKIA